MGPRSVERGNWRPSSAFGLKRRVLQWGRVRLNAETTHPRRFVQRPFVASMGPRSVERGNLRSERTGHPMGWSFNGVRAIKIMDGVWFEVIDGMGRLVGCVVGVGGIGSA